MSEKSALSVNPDVMSTNQQNDGSNQVAALYNAMIVPLSGYTIRGFIWYQGESNKGFHKTYPANMAAMVSDWRSLWGGGEQMPFYYVQLAPFDYDIPMHRFEGQKNGILLPLMVGAAESPVSDTEFRYGGNNRYRKCHRYSSGKERCCRAETCLTGADRHIRNVRY